MLKLHSSKNLAIELDQEQSYFVTRITTNQNLIEPLRTNETLLIQNDIDSIPSGFKLVLLADSALVKNPSSSCDVIRLDTALDYLEDGDVIRFNPSRIAISVLYRRRANTNSFLVTERCNSFCLMCSQPPREIDDSYRVKDILDAIPLISPDAPEIGITGGEPTLLGDDLFRILLSLKRHLPTTAAHVLTNGRNFEDVHLAQKAAEIEHPDLMFGIPLYSDISTIHNFVVQADNAFDETIRGILNLKQHKLRVEIRVVLHLQTYQRLPQLAEFIARNLLFVDHVALMGLEIMGFTRANLEELWIDPLNYQAQLSEAVTLLNRAGIRVSIYNLQLCLLPHALWPFAVKSISDWKNEYIDLCDSCEVKNDCGGFFSSSEIRRSTNIKPVQGSSSRSAVNA